MNIKVDIDMTPEEVRRLVGLPDVQEFNQQVMTKMMEKLTAGAEGFDPMNLFQASIMNNTEFAKKWMDAFNLFSSSKN
ncbi:DUF6489 family protein [Thiolinea disciformis]|uniref:DUF6489 family protein n=1 Tax=Thiolinea disciformis TaxID=125614 RepID=UPI0003825DA5|nr:DUF6489 family protein [Thiolinea disciformis]